MLKAKAHIGLHQAPPQTAADAPTPLEARSGRGNAAREGGHGVGAHDPEVVVTCATTLATKQVPQGSLLWQRTSDKTHFSWTPRHKIRGARHQSCQALRTDL